MKKTVIIVLALAALILAIIITVELAIANDRQDKIGNETFTDNMTTEATVISEINPITTDVETACTASVDNMTVK